MNFILQKKTKDGYGIYCIECSRIKSCSQKKKKRDTPEGRIYFLLKHYKEKDFKNNWFFDLDLSFLINLTNNPCYYCGDTELIGADRKDNLKGHSKDNVLPCCTLCNRIRSNKFTVDEMLILGKSISKIKKARK